MRWTVLLFGAVALGGLAAGCGGSSATPPASAPSGANGFAAYTECLAKNGVVLPSASANPRGTRNGTRPSTRPSDRPSGGTGNGGGGGGFGGFAFGNNPPAGVDQATWDKAMQACQSVRPSFGGNGGANNTALVAYRNCLTEHGVVLPSGRPSAGPGGGGGFGGLGSLNTADPKVAAALAACEPLRPTGGPRPSSTPAP
jgi:hypothetical protein